MASTLSHKTSILPILKSILRYFFTTKVSFRIFPIYRCHNLNIFKKLSPGIGPQCVVKELRKVLQFLNKPKTDPIAACIKSNHIGPYKRPKRPEYEEKLILRKIKKKHIEICNQSYIEIVNRFKNEL